MAYDAMGSGVDYEDEEEDECECGDGETRPFCPHCASTNVFYALKVLPVPTRKPWIETRLRLIDGRIRKVTVRFTEEPECVLYFASVCGRCGWWMPMFSEEELNPHKVMIAGG